MPHTQRQGPGQRQDDIDGALAKALFLAVKNPGRVIAGCAVVSSLLTFAATTIAARVYAPDVQQIHAEVKDIKVKVDSTVTRVGRLETSSIHGAAERDTLRETLRWQSFILCDYYSASHPGARSLPPICKDK